MSLLSEAFVLVTLLCRLSFSFASIHSFQFDVNDILNEKFMPAHLLAQEIETFLKGSSNMTREHFYKQNNTNCNFTVAFSTMGFHRRMMNEYLATNFLAKQVLSEFPVGSVPLLERRIGAANSNSTVDTKPTEDNHRRGKYIPNELLEDPGSSSYQSWLDKTTTLEDIQRQFSEKINAQVNNFKPLNREAGSHRKSADNDADDLEVEDFDDGDITGYAYTGGSIDSAPSYPQPLPPPRQHLSFDATKTIQNFQPLYPTAGSKNGYYPPSGHDAVYNDNYGPPHSVQPQLPQQIKEIGLKDILDIALTTLAFLSFGMFILQVLMCITMNKDDTSNMMMMPMEATDGATVLQANNNEAIEEIRRRKRDSPGHRRIEMMNELSRRVLHSIDAVLLMPKDEGRCHYRSLCEMNKFARHQKNGQKIWIPMWSLGMSWFSSKVVPPDATTSNPILESLKAAIMGLGNGDCEKVYRKCQTNIIAEEREKLESRIKNRDLSNEFKWDV